MTQSNTNSPSSIKDMPTSPFVSVIAAMSNNRVIGKDGDLPWDIPLDLQYFKSMTKGKPIIMGRKTYESIGKPLPERHNIIVTTQKNWQVNGADIVHSVHDAIALASNHTDNEIMVIGGSEIYSNAIILADKLYITHINVELEGDAYFPEINPLAWRKAGGSGFFFTKLNDKDISYQFVKYDRIKH